MARTFLAIGDLLLRFRLAAFLRAAIATLGLASTRGTTLLGSFFGRHHVTFGGAFNIRIHIVRRGPFEFRLREITSFAKKNITGERRTLRRNLKSNRFIN